MLAWLLLYAGRMMCGTNFSPVHSRDTAANIEIVRAVAQSVHERNKGVAVV